MEYLDAVSWKHVKPNYLENIYQSCRRRVLNHMPERFRSDRIDRWIVWIARRGLLVKKRYLGSKDEVESFLMHEWDGGQGI